MDKLVNIPVSFVEGLEDNTSWGLSKDGHFNMDTTCHHTTHQTKANFTLKFGDWQ